MDSPRLRVLSQLTLLLGIVLVGTASCGGSSSAEVTQSVDASLGPRHLLVEVRDRSGQPIQDARVWAENDSGGNRGTTDASGRVHLVIGEGRIRALHVDEVAVRRWRGHLDLPQGVHFRVAMKNLPPRTD